MISPADEPQGEMLALAAADYRLVLDPIRGGSVARFDWRGEPLMRPTCGPSVLDTACFPLVPFSNRIAFGRFRAGDRQVRLAPNFPGADHPHPLHGFGWLAPWIVVRRQPASALLRHRYAGGEWPWPYEAEQEFSLSERGLLHLLRVRNLAPNPMPAGLGFHPYFPRREGTRYRGLHRGEWTTSADGLPVQLKEEELAVDWWHGSPVATRSVDTVYTGRSGPLEITWPERRMRLTLDPSSELSFTVVYVPPDADFFCVEPVSHATDAVNRPGADGMCWLEPGQTMEVSVRYAAERLPGGDERED